MTGAGNVTTLDGNSGYQYDAASELQSSPSASYAYDALTERTGVTPTGGSTTGYSYDQAGNLTAFTPPTGNPTGYGYDGNGLVASETTGTRAGLVASDQTTTSLPLLLSDSQNNHIYGPGGLAIEQIDSSGTPTYLHHDQLGSTRLITNSSGNSVATLTYNPYGALAASSGTATTPLGFAGQYTDPESGSSIRGHAILNLQPASSSPATHSRPSPVSPTPTPITTRSITPTQAAWTADSSTPGGCICPTQEAVGFMGPR